ncbi:MAG: 30S ribosomal protein S16 [Firmicutes bacterium]|nr:30S ribosomal protein S16 [Bacillota bacterium]
MAVKIRLTRLGKTHAPFYRVVATDSRQKRDGEYLENLGTYDPLKNPAEIKIDVEAAKKWLDNGAQPTATAKAVLVKAGIKFAKSKTKTSTKRPAQPSKKKAK